MLKRALMVAVTAVVISVPAVAGAAAKHKPKSHALKVTAGIYNFSPPGGIKEGRQVYAGVIDGTIGGKTVHGAIRGVNNVTGTSFTGTATIFYVSGTLSLTITGSGAPAPANTLTFTGSGKTTGGTGAYKGATGKFTFTGKSGGGDPDNDGDANIAVFTVTGSARY